MPPSVLLIAYLKDHPPKVQPLRKDGSIRLRLIFRGTVRILYDVAIRAQMGTGETYIISSSD